MDPWIRFFIVDTSVTAVQGLRFGYGFIAFNEKNEPLFGRDAQNVKLYEKVEDATADFNKIDEKVAIVKITITIVEVPNAQPQRQVQVEKIATK